MFVSVLQSTCRGIASTTDHGWGGVQLSVMSYLLFFALNVSNHEDTVSTISELFFWTLTISRSMHGQSFHSYRVIYTYVCKCSSVHGGGGTWLFLSRLYKFVPCKINCNVQTNFNSRLANWKTLTKIHLDNGFVYFLHQQLVKICLYWWLYSIRD